MKGSVTLFTTVQVRVDGLDIEDPEIMMAKAQKIASESTILSGALTASFASSVQSGEMPIITGIQEDPDLTPWCQVFQGPLDEGDEFLYEAHPLTKEMVPFEIGKDTLSERSFKLVRDLAKLKGRLKDRSAALPNELDNLIREAENIASS